MDNCRHEREEEGVSDEYLNIRAKFLQLIPDTFSMNNEYNMKINFIFHIVFVIHGGLHLF